MRRKIVLVATAMIVVSFILAVVFFLTAPLSDPISDPKLNLGLQEQLNKLVNKLDAEVKSLEARYKELEARCSQCGFVGLPNPKQARILRVASAAEPEFLPHDVRVMVRKGSDNGPPAQGVKVHFFLDDVPAGSVQTGVDGLAVFQISRPASIRMEIPASSGCVKRCVWVVPREALAFTSGPLQIPGVYWLAPNGSYARAPDGRPILVWRPAIVR